ncbi:hypothetical protein TNCT_678371 [Trichonephila clavata]|uniref:Uncharacterized protein n=1 Tax=Trichonephila clavata TaxID=2740835 RepID=A0A8X6JHV6_TRICU|nr:hypothetical protein TNCT_678371 [Trichonephila clavata]
MGIPPFFPQTFQSRDERALEEALSPLSGWKLVGRPKTPTMAASSFPTREGEDAIITLIGLKRVLPFFTAHRTISTD